MFLDSWIKILKSPSSQNIVPVLLKCENKKVLITVLHFLHAVGAFLVISAKAMWSTVLFKLKCSCG